MNAKGLKEGIDAAELPKHVANVLYRKVEAAEQEGTDTVAIARTLALPWEHPPQSAEPLAEVARILHEQLHLTPRATDIITEHLAVHRVQTTLSQPASSSQPLLCLTGPPSVGKSTVATRLAAVLNRKVQVVDLQRLGSREDFLGSSAAPGALMKSVGRAGSADAVVVLDGLDQLGTHWPSDPFAVLHQLTNPELRRSFLDPYFGVPFDLSNVLLIATAAWVQELPSAAQRQLDVVEIEGYIDTQKVAIARDTIVPSIMAEYDVSPDQIAFEDEALDTLIRTYTAEAGVSELERLVRQIIRGTLTRNTPDTSLTSLKVTTESLTDLLGRSPLLSGRTRHTERSGVAGVLVVGPNGGAYAGVEAVHMPGGGRIMVSGTDGSDLTRRVGPVASLVRSRLADFQIPARFLEEFDTHLLLPVGCMPGDELAIGLAATIAFVSLMRDRPVDQELAATGPVTLHGRILPTLGVRHKMLAAHRAGVRRVLLPRGSEAELDDLPARVHDDITFIPVDDVAQALHVALR